jgi:hypothetical protein
MFIKITSLTLATTREHPLHIAQTPPLNSYKQIAQETRPVPTEAAPATITTTARKIHISNAKEIICIGLTPAETRKAHRNIVQTDAQEIPAEIITATPQFKRLPQQM